MKTCTRCGITKSLDEFRKHKYASQKPDSVSKGRSSWCRACINNQRKEYYAKNYTKVQAGVINWRDRNKDKYLRYMRDRYVQNRESYKNDALLRQYAISLDDYYFILSLQDNHCAICLSDSPGRGSKYFHVDHCHETKIIRGLLCTSCNKGLGLFKDSPSILQEASTYLENAYDCHIVEALSNLPSRHAA